MKFIEGGFSRGEGDLMNHGQTGRGGRVAWLWLAAWMMWLVSAGCREAAGPQAMGPSTGTPTVFEYSASELSALGAYLPPLDEQRVCVAPPKQWHVRPRSEAYLARFARDTRIFLPRITVEAAQPGFEELRDVDRDSVVEFARLVASSLGDATQRMSQVGVRPVVLGEVPCALYMVRVSLKVADRSHQADREVLTTLYHGRMYRVVLDVFPGQLDDYRADAFAVMAGMQFLAPLPSDEVTEGPDGVDAPALPPDVTPAQEGSGP
jgi:hypothetical protein